MWAKWHDIHENIRINDNNMYHNDVNDALKAIKNHIFAYT